MLSGNSGKNKATPRLNWRSFSGFFSLTDKRNLLVSLLVIFSFLTRVYRLDYPKTYVFDEVYYPYTAIQYLKGNTQAWEWWTKAPDEGTAYSWVNPPLAQEIMTVSMFLLQNQSSWAWRLPGVIMGTLAVFLLYCLGKKVFDEKVGLLAAFLFSVDGLNFVLSRTGMLDIYLVAFSLLTLFFYFNRQFFFSAVCLGLTVATKWTGVYLFIFLLTLVFKDKLFKKVYLYILITPTIYLVTYLPFFLTNHSLNQFLELLKQEWYYHLHLDATHSYASKWWSWPLGLVPVWYFVDYPKNQIANIFAAANPVVFWLGSLSIIFTIKDFLQKKGVGVFLTVLGFIFFWLPWSLSPRIMFLYYFAPAVPFLCLSLSYQITKLSRNPKYQVLPQIIIILSLLGFIALFPYLTGIALPRNLVDLFFKTNLAKNPFI